MSEVRLIDANALKVALDKCGKEPDYQHEGEDWRNGICIAENLIDNAPTVDVKEEKIIRCIDCKYYDPFKHWCDYHEDWAGGEDGFCSLAKMKGGAE